MKTISIFSLTIFLGVSGTFAQQNGALTSRYEAQLKFITANFITDQKISVNTLEELDSLFLAVEKSWEKYIGDSLVSKISSEAALEAFHQLDSYFYSILFKITTGNTKHLKDLEFHLLKNYMLPALSQDVKTLQKDKTMQSLRLIWIGALGNTLAYGLDYFEDKKVINDLYITVTDLQKLLEEPMLTREMVINKDEKVDKMNRQLLNVLKSDKYELEAKYYFINGQEDKAFERFITGVSTNQIPVYNILPFSKVLIRYFSEIGSKDQSLALLNNIMFSTSNDEIPRDSLRVLYYEVDGLKGEELYQRIRKKSGSNFLSISDVTLSSDPKAWSFLANGLKSDQLQKAKYILIDFWHLSCGPCILEIPELNEFNNLLKDHEDIVFISINADHFNTERDREAVKEGLAKYNVQFPVVFDDDSLHLSKELNIKGYPTKIIINSRGEILEKLNGSFITVDTFMALLSDGE